MYGKVRLLVEKTLEELKIDTHQLLESSHDKVYVQCNTCGFVFAREYRNLHFLHDCPLIVDRNGVRFLLCQLCGSYKPRTEFGKLNHNNYICVSCQPSIPYFLDRHIRLECKLLHSDAKLPFRKRTTDAGYDIYTIENQIVYARSYAKISTGIVVSPPDGYYLTIEGRSSLGIKGIVPFRGIIDGTYQGELLVTLINHSSKDYIVSVHDRIAQIILHEVNHADLCLISEFTPTFDGRLADGFGSSGK